MNTPLTLQFLKAALAVLLWQGVCVGHARAAEEATATVDAPAPSTVSPQEERRDIGDGAQTRLWLKQQGDRTQASTKRQTLSGPVMHAVHERYVRSFTSPIPERITVPGVSK